LFVRNVGTFGRGAYLNNTYEVYVLGDESGNLYKGMTSNLKRRIHKHRSGKTRTTSHMICFEVMYTESYSLFDEARKRELYLKSAAGRRFLKKILGS